MERNFGFRPLVTESEARIWMANHAALSQPYSGTINTGSVVKETAFSPISDNAHIHPMLRTDQNLVALCSEPGKDKLIEDCRGNLADFRHFSLRAHATLLLFFRQRGYGAESRKYRR